MVEKDSADKSRRSQDTKFSPDEEELWGAITDPSLEFDMFENVRRKLAEIFVGGGHAPLEAEKIALYVVQGVRNVPKLLKIMTRAGPPRTHEEILDALGLVLDEAPALVKAKRLLLRLDVEGSEHPGGPP